MHGRSIVYLLPFLVIVLGREPRLRPDRPFPAITTLDGRNVTCKEGERGQFVAPTFSCTDIRVNGKRLTYSYIPGMGAKKCGKFKDEITESDKNDIAALCNALLHAHNIQGTLWTAYVSEASCQKVSETQVTFNNREPHSQWNDIVYDPKKYQDYGHVKSIQCMLME